MAPHQTEGIYQTLLWTMLCLSLSHGLTRPPRTFLYWHTADEISHTICTLFIFSFSYFLTEATKHFCKSLWITAFAKFWKSKWLCSVEYFSYLINHFILWAILFGKKNWRHHPLMENAKPFWKLMPIPTHFILLQRWVMGFFQSPCYPTFPKGLSDLRKSVWKKA